MGKLPAGFALGAVLRTHRKTARLTHDKGAGPPRPREGDAHIARFAASLPGRHEVADQHPKIDRLEPGTGQLGVGPRRFSDIADQPVEADHVLPDHVETVIDLELDEGEPDR